MSLPHAAAKPAGGSKKKKKNSRRDCFLEMTFELVSAQISRGCESVNASNAHACIRALLLIWGAAAMTGGNSWKHLSGAIIHPDF